MEFEWDENKNRSNITKHGIAFEQVGAVFYDSNILTFEDTRFEYGETRLISIGQMFLITQGKPIVIVVVHTQREKVIRLISARKANQRERKLYEQNEEKQFFT